MFKEYSSTGRLVVFDLEWNQSSYRPNLRMPHEIIEIGACRVDENGAVIDSFSRMIKPRLYKKLDKHIRQVTGITEEELASGDSFSDVFGEFIEWCGSDVRLVTWGRDDFPVLRRNAAFFMTPMPFDPPIDAQAVFGLAYFKDHSRQMNLHAALEEMQLSPEVPAHRAVYDAQCTALLLPMIDKMVDELSPEMMRQMEAMLEKEARIACSAMKSVPTHYAYQSEALADRNLMMVSCPVCGGPAMFDVPWFDNGRDKYLSVTQCRTHGAIYGQMHFKRGTTDMLIMHQRIYRASQADTELVRRQYEQYLQTPPTKRHHRLNMTDAAKKREQKDVKPPVRE